MEGVRIVIVFFSFPCLFSNFDCLENSLISINFVKRLIDYFLLDYRTGKLKVVERGYVLDCLFTFLIKLGLGVKSHFQVVSNVHSQRFSACHKGEISSKICHHNSCCMDEFFLVRFESKIFQHELTSCKKGNVDTSLQNRFGNFFDCLIYRGGYKLAKINSNLQQIWT